MPSNIEKSQYESLRDKWKVRYAESKENLWQKHNDSLTWIQKNVHPQKLLAGSLSGLMLLSLPAYSSLHAIPTNISAPVVHNVQEESTVTPTPTSLPTETVIPTPIETAEINKFLGNKKTIAAVKAENNRPINEKLSAILPSQVAPLTPEQESKIGKTLSDSFGIKVSAELNSIRLNRSYGYIGAEQHLALYPGDNMSVHFQHPDDTKYFEGSGMAPGRGAWGYFASSKAALTQEDIDRERYYIAVPTFLSTNFADNVNKNYNFFKYRKMLVVNPDNGKALIADIADSGPAPFTGKHLGGSPEVMRYLDRSDGRSKGGVLYFFLDDSNNAVPLGPINTK